MNRAHWKMLIPGLYIYDICRTRVLSMNAHSLVLVNLLWDIALSQNIGIASLA